MISFESLFCVERRHGDTSGCGGCCRPAWNGSCTAPYLVAPHWVSANFPSLVNSAEPIFTINFTVFLPKYWLSLGSHWMSRKNVLAPLATSWPTFRGNVWTIFP